MIELSKLQKIHFIGLKGMGMVALAQVMHARGIAVSGSDVDEEFPSDSVVERLGISCARGFAPEHIPDDCDAIVVSSAFEKQNAELDEARRRGISILSYTQALGLLTREYTTIAICGTHGKTTTTSMIGRMMEDALMDPTVIVGAQVREWGTNARIGASKWLVVEADEYQNKLANYKADIIICTAIDWDHPDYFLDEQSYTQVFSDFINRLPSDGYCIGYGDDVDVLEAMKYVHARSVTYGRGAHRGVRIIEESSTNGGSRFFIHDEHRSHLGPFELTLAGKHNVSNAGAAIALSIRLGIPLEIVRKSLKQFRGAQRRMEVIGSVNHAIIMDDYAHHPVEIQATLAGVRQAYPDRRICVFFQPHTFSRTEALKDDFIQSFANADQVYVTDVFASARESGGTLTSQDFVEFMKPYHRNAKYLPWLEALPTIQHHLEPNDCWIMMGAGDGWKIARALVSAKQEGESKR